MTLAKGYLSVFCQFFQRTSLTNGLGRLNFTVCLKENLLRSHDQDDCHVHIYIIETSNNLPFQNRLADWLETVIYHLGLYYYKVYKMVTLG